MVTDRKYSVGLFPFDDCSVPVKELPKRRCNVVFVLIMTKHQNQRNLSFCTHSKSTENGHLFGPTLNNDFSCIIECLQARNTSDYYKYWLNVIKPNLNLEKYIR